MKYLSVLFFLSFAAISLFAAENRLKEQEAVSTNSVLASCNGKPITLGDVLPMTFSRENRAFSLYSGMRLEEEIKNIRREAVDELIDKQIILKEYQEQTFRISDQDVESTIDKMAEEMGCQSREELRRRLKAHNMEEAEFRKKVEENLIVQYMMARNVYMKGDPTPKELYDYFTEHRQELSGVETIELSMLKLPLFTADFEAVKQSLTDTLNHSPERFEEMVKIYSPGDLTGRLGEIECSKMRPEFIALLTDHTPGKVFGPVMLEDGAVWLKILSHHEPTAVSFAEMEPKIRETLQAQRMQQAKKEYAAKLRNHNVIEYYQ